MTIVATFCPQEVVGPQDCKSELDQFGKLFVGGLDYSATDSRTTLSSEKMSSSLCSYELDIDAPKEPVQDGTACTVAFVDAFSARRDVTLCVCASGSAIEWDIVELIRTLFHFH
ncbi:hypothetical protein HPB47_022926 [Ixodes persulcatus]|uniref:Uncharacterized protein n=1 Tax=Ixodes persulcatus TaxID=34615 RepID=A0AC60Q8D9_IXOPE|nr:hypothetical protein HPB47_022926 [Ixodes persulcatus]